MQGALFGVIATLLVKHTLGDLKVAHAMSRALETLSESDTLGQAISLTLNTLQSEFPILSEGDGSVRGILCQKDMLKALRTIGESSNIRGVMRSDFPIVKGEESLFRAQRKMAEAGLIAVPVLDGMNQLEGLLTARDINEAYQLASAKATLHALGA